MANSVQLQRRRFNAATHLTFTGAQGEFTFNTDTNRIHAHDGETADGWPHALLSETGVLKAVARAVNLNAQADTTIAISLPPGVASYRVERIDVTNSGGALPSTAKIGVYTGASEGGTAIAAQQALTGISSQAANTNGNLATLTLTDNNSTAFEVTTLYVNVGTVQGAAATIDVIVSWRPL